jgi:hypothetical protein
VDSQRSSPLRDLIAFLVVVSSYPIALFGGKMLACVAQGFSARCATSAIAISPVILLASGVVAGLVTCGWTGLLVGFVGNLVGISLVLVLSFGIGQAVPLDPVSGLMAMVWFAFPSLAGYGIGRLVAKRRARRKPALVEASSPDRPAVGRTHPPSQPAADPMQLPH